MFVTFIAIIVILIVIVSIMNTGVTSSSGGTDQTKAVKAITEVSTLAQNSGFYKSLSENNDYEGLTTQALVDNGIVDAGDVVTVDGNTTAATDFVDEAGNNPANNTVLVKSKAIPGFYYEVVAGPDNNHLEVKVWKKTADAPATGDSLAKAVDKAYGKFGQYDQSNHPEGVYSNTANDDGLATIVFR